jgi:HD-like signal output (HDOD) protein
MASLAIEDVSFAHLATVIERDTVLSGNVLRLVNSALYGRRGTISSVRAAVSILGLVKLRNYVLGLSVSRIWAKAVTPVSWRMEHFNAHATAVAVMSDILVQKRKFDYPEGAFAGGLLHDIGRLLVAISLPDEYERIQRAFEISDEPLEVHEMAVIETTHAALSAAALQRWSLPQPIQRAVLYHPQGEPDPGPTASDLLPLSAALHAADKVANHLGICIHQADERHGMPPEAAFAAIGLEEQAGAVMGEFDAEYATLREQF